MTKDLRIFLIFLLCLSAIKADSVEDCSEFENQKKDQCTSLGDGTKCFYDGQCKDKYEDCGSYNPTSESDQTCSQITPKITETADYYKKCAVKKDSNGKFTCEKVYKECGDLTEAECKSNIDIDLGDNKRCVYVGDKCELHYNSCTDNDIKEKQDLCKANIPKNNQKKCEWQSSCTETDRECKDYIEYKNYYEQQAPCNDLKHTSPKICFYNGNSCNEVYKSCEDYSSADETCTSIKPLTETSSGSGIYNRDYYHKCVGESNKCVTKDRTCSDFKIQEDPENLCRLLTSEKDSTGNKASCILQEESCNDVYLKCEYYDELVTDSTKRTQDVCTSSIAVTKTPGYDNEHYKCSFKSNDNNKCVTELKSCTEISDSQLCSIHTNLLTDKEQKCIYNGDTCQQEYKNCDTYNDHFTDKSQISKTECEAITPVYDSPDTKNYICVYQEATSNTNKACKKQEITKCEDYTGKDKTRCENLPVNDTSIFKCSLVDNKCVTQYKDCSAYNTDITKNKKEIYKSVCESIVISDDYYRCFLEDDKTCSKKQKICSDYEGEDETECQNYRVLNKNKICGIENKKCVEKFRSIINQYYYCSEYRGTDKAFCESIQPYNYQYSYSSSYYYPDYSFKCVYGEKGCEKIRKKCEEAKNQNECQSISPFDTDKMCVYNNGCIEQYKSCSAYNKQDKVEQAVCENILMQGYKCKFTAGTGNNKNTCTEEALKCSEFKLNLLGDTCTNIQSSLTDQTKKCTFNDNTCSVDDKTCLDLYDYSSADSETCQNTKTSLNDRKCIYNSYGCMEIMEEVEEITKTEKSSGDNFIENRYLLGFIFAIFAVLA